MEERWTLCIDRIKEIASDPQVKEPFGSYFRKVASFLLKHADLYEKQQAEGTANHVFNKATVAELYGELEEQSYVNSYTNPTYAVSVFGMDLGRLLSFVYAEMFSLPAYAARGEKFELLIRMEWFVELYCIFEGGKEDADASLYQNAWECCYWFVSDYMDVETERRVGEKVEPSFDFAYRLIMESDLTDLSYLYRYGEYISDNEIETAKLLNAMPEAKLQKMADTYTEGYRIGFIKGNKDISIKEIGRAHV